MVYTSTYDADSSLGYLVAIHFPPNPNLVRAREPPSRRSFILDGAREHPDGTGQSGLLRVGTERGYDGLNWPHLEAL